jgi:Flp pilus assembly pilin Flp
VEIGSRLTAGSMAPSLPLGRERGQTMPEYALVLALIGLGLVLSLTQLGGAIAAALGRAVGVISGGG